LAFTPHGATASSFGNGASGTVAITGTGFANDGATDVTLTAAAASHTTFTDVVETSATTATADFSSTGAATPGTFGDVVLTDDNGASAAFNSAFTIDAAPTFTSITPDSIWEGTAPTTATITGSGFGTGVTVAITADPSGTPLTATITSSTATSIVLTVSPTNPVSSGPATPGDYNVTVSNTDGGSVTGGDAFSVGNGLENLSPSAEAAVGTVTVALLGSGFQYGATATLTSDGTTADTGACLADITNAGAAPASGLAYAVATTITSPTSGTITLPITAVAAAQCDVSVTNTGAGNNDDIFTLDGAFGLGEASDVAPVITSSNSTTPLVVGAAATTVTLTGSGFSSYSTVTTPPAAGDDVTYSAANGAGGTSLTFNAAVASGAVEGPVIVTVGNDGADTTYTPAISIAGPVITSQAPNLVEGAAFGTTVTLTGTGFTNTTTGTVAGGGTGLAGTVSYLSPTTMSVVVTTSPTTGTTGATVTLHDVTATGTVNSVAFPLTIDAAPVVNAPVTYATGAPSDVGVGATATTVYINGSGFLTGATVTAFTNGAGVADPNVTATVTGVNATGTQITATVAIKAPDTNTAVGYTVTNTDGGSVKVAAFAEPIFIGAGPTITSVTPVTGDAGATTTFALAGTGYETGAVVTLSPANGTCGTPTISASTTLSVACTLGSAGVTPTYIVVTNPDGGSATSTTAVLGAQAVAKPFHVGAVHGAATVGKTVTILISGTGFYGQPKVTATGFKFGVKKDSGTVLTIRVTTKATVKAGEHELTVKLANGKSGKAGFDVKK
jgi:hypothetical protein